MTANSTHAVDIRLLISRRKDGPPITALLVSNHGHVAGDRTEEVTEFEMGNGFLWGFSVFNRGEVKRGELFAEVFLARFASGVKMASGYIFDGHDLRDGEFGSPLEGRGLRVTNEATSTLVNNVALTRTITVPTNTRWLLHGGTIFNVDNVARDCRVRVDNGTTGQNLAHLMARALGAGDRKSWPRASDTPVANEEPAKISPLPLSEVDRILIIWDAGGASAGGTARSSAVVEEFIEV